MATQATVNRHGRERMIAATVVREFSRRKMVLAGGRQFSVAEDLFNGCFDGVGFAKDGRLLCAQWTSSNSGAISYRRRKIERQFCRAFAEAERAEDGPRDLRARMAEMVTVELWAWIARRGFRVWRWEWCETRWIETSAPDGIGRRRQLSRALSRSECAKGRGGRGK